MPSSADCVVSDAVTTRRSCRAVGDHLGRRVGLGLDGHPVPGGTRRHRTLDVIVAMPRELEVWCAPRDRQLSRVMSLVAAKTHHRNSAHRVVTAVLSRNDVVQIEVPG